MPARGNLAPFSSHGPTADGRVKPDITAPGAVVVSSLNSYDTQYNATSPYVAASTVWNSRTYYFGAFMGTSMATPVVTGIIALMLEQDPTLTPENVKDIFKSNSISDSFTGTIPVDGSETWGWGKINAYADLNSLITKPDPPSITVNGDLEFCPGDSVELSGPTGFKYGWSNGDTSRIIQAKNAGSYTLRVQDTGTGAWSLPSDPVQVTHFSLPAVSIQSAGSTAFCTGGSVLLEAVGDPSNSYEWFLNNIDTHNSTISLSVNSSGIYTVQATDGNSCVNISGAVTVSVSPKPDKPVVTDVNNVLKSDASTGNRWYYNNSLINGATADTIQVIKSGNYYDAVFSNDGCSTNSDTFNIETRPVISVEGALSFCKGDSVILSAPEGYHYQWTSGETTRQIAVKNSGSYAFNITDIYSLTSDNSDTVNITVHDLPAVNLNTRGMVSLCNHDTLSLIAHGPAVNQYQWYRDGESLDNPDSMLQVFSKGSYAALVTDTGMCVNHTDTVTINILELPDVRIINQGPLSFCSGDSVSLLVQSDSSNHFEWYDDGSSLNNSDSLFRVFSSGNYTVAATDSNQCRNYSDTLRVTVNPLPAKPEIASDLNYLITDNTAGIQWFFNHDSIPGAVHDTLVVTQPGNYYSIVMNDSGCYINSDTVNITELGLAERSNTDWLIYPNPAHNFLTVESRFTGPAEIYIIDMNGRLMIKKQVWLTGKDEIDLGRLAGGLYLLTIVREESIYQTKILVR